ARLLRIGRTVRAVAGTGLGEVAFARRRTAGEGRRLEAVRRAGAAAARAGLRDVASTRRRRPADGAPVPGVVDAERATDRAIALVRRAHVAIVRAGRPRRLHGVVRTGRARPGAGLGVVALVRRRAARRARVAWRVLADAARAIAGVGRTDVAVVRARGAVRLERARRGAARPRRPVVGPVVARLLGLENAVAADGQRGHGPAGIGQVVV